MKENSYISLFITALLVGLFYGYKKSKLINKLVNIFVALMIIISIFAVIIPHKSEKEISIEYFNSLKD